MSEIAATEVHECLTCTADEAANHDAVLGSEHPIRKGWHATKAELWQINWHNNTGMVRVTYTNTRGG